METLNQYVYIIYFCIGSVLMSNMLVVWVHKQVPKKLRYALCICLGVASCLFFNAGGKVMTDYEEIWTTSTLVFALLFPCAISYLVYVLLIFFKSLGNSQKQ